MIQEHIHRDAFAKLAGIKLLEAHDGTAIAHMKIEKKHLNGLGIVQGGALFTLADLTLGAAVHSVGGEYVTMSAQINFIKGKGEGTLIGIAKKISSGKTISNYDVEIRLEETDELIAIFRGSTFKRAE